MPKTGEGKREEIIKDSMLKVIKVSEAVALQAVESASAVLKAGLANAEDLTVKASDILLNTARKAVGAGSIVGSDACEATKNMVKGTIRAASEIGGELKEIASAAVQGSPTAEKPEEAKSE